MKKYLIIFIICFSIPALTTGQQLEDLKLTETEIPGQYSVSLKNNCISLQACLFYDKPEMYEMLIGKIKKKEIQNFESLKDNGSIMYFEFENGFQGAGFLDGLLWGESMKPTNEHPEKYYSKENYLVIWSFNKGSLIQKLSEDKVKQLLK